MKYAPYSAYKVRAMSWLDRMPEHWDVLGIKRKYKVINGGTPSSADEEYWDGGITWLTPEDLGKNSSKTIGASRRQISREGLINCGASETPPGSIVLSTRAPIGHLAITETESTTNQGARTLVPRSGDVCVDFHYYALLASKAVFQAAGKGTTFLELSAGQLGIHPIPMPPLKEQQTIARFLDAKTAQIDTLVVKKRQLVDKLKEKRSALIARTVTRGLPPEAAKAAGLEPNPEMKDSGVEWFGVIPSHWSVARLRHKCLIVDCKHKTVSFVDEGIPLASIKEVHDFEVALGDAKMTTVEEYHELIEGGRKPHVGDLIYSRNASVGDAALVTTESTFCMGQDVCLVRAKEQDGRFMAYLFRSHPLKEQVESLMIGSTFRRINVGQIKAFWICLPPPQEQRSIAAYLDWEMEKLDRLTSEVETAITRLTEYRQALITSAVTGKIDVRNCQAEKEAA